MDFWREKFKYIFVQHKYKTTWRAIATFMAAVVVFVTTYGMILPAITMETEIAEEMPGIQLEHNAEPEQMVEDDLSDGLTGGSGIPETSVEPQDPEDHAGQDITGTDTGASDTAAVALLTAKTEKTEAIISNVSGEMFPGGMSLSIEELKKDGFEYNAYCPIVQNKANSDVEESGDWSDCDVRIFDLRFFDADGFEVILSQEMNAEIRFSEPMAADLCKIVLLTDERDDLTGDPTVINADSVQSRNNHTLELIRDGNNAVIGFRFRAEAISLAALLTKQVEAETDVESNGEPEEEIVAEQGTELEASDEIIEEPETESEEETATESETDTESTGDTEVTNPETDETQEEEISQDVTTEDEAAGEKEDETELEETVDPEEETESEEAVDTIEETEDQKDDTSAATEEAAEDQDMDADAVDEETDKADNEESDVEETEVEDQEVEATEDTVEGQEAEGAEDSVDEQEAEGAEDSVDEQEAEESEESVDEQETEEPEDSADEKEAEESEDTDEEREVEEPEDSADDQDSEENDPAEEDESEDDERTEQLEEDLSLTYPAQVFDKHTDNVHVYVNAPEGAFPADTDMRIEDVVDQDTIDKIEDAVDENVSKVIAVNISFFAPDDKETEIQPLIPVQVVIKAEESAKSEEIKVVHVDDNGVAKEVGTVNLTEPGESDGGTQATIIEPGTNAEVDDAVNVETGSDEAVEEPGTVSAEESAAESTTEPAEESSTEESETTEVSDDTSAVNTTMSGRRNVRLSVANRTPALNVETNESPRESETTFEELISGNEEGSELVTFYAGGFSIYALVYTVDFEYSVNGKMYQFSLPGGGFVSFTDLVEVLGITHDTNSDENEDKNESVIAENAEENGDNEGEEENGVYSDTNTPLTLGDVEVSEATRKFVADVASVECSSPELVDVSKVDADITVGQIKDSRGLGCEYSADLTKEQIAEINAQTVGAGDWALISVRPFTSEESLTVTMKDGEVFTIRVTDAQIKKTVIDAKGDTWEITVTYGEDAQIPNGAELKVKEILPEDEEYTQYYQQTLEKVGVNTPETDKTEEGSNASAADVIKDSVEEHTDLIVSANNEEETEEPEKKAASGYTRIFNIEIWADGHKVEPAADVTVNIKLLDAPEETEAAPQVVHFAEDGAELMELKELGENSENEGIQFVTDEFSVYSVVYTVDFSYEVNGKVYGFTMQGADSVSLRALIDALHVYELAEKEKSDYSDSDSQFEIEVATTDLAEEDDTENTALDSFMSDIKTVTFSNEQLLVPVKVEEDTAVGKIKTGLNLFPTYPLGLKQSEVLELNAKEYTAGDWVLISLKAFDTEETLTITMNTGESFAIIVTDAQDAVMVGDQVQTIPNPAGTTIDLFDYWIVSQNLVGREGWGDLNQSQGSAEAGDDKPLNGTGNNKGINSSASDSEHGHALKFSPAWAGTVYNGNKIGTTGNAWQSVNLDMRNGLNSYTGDEATWHWNCPNPFTGIVQNNLYNGYPILTNNQTIGSNGESLAYLFDPSIAHDGKASYDGVNQLLYVDKDGYYTYDSRDYAASFNTGDKTFTLTEQTSSNSEIRGFWPFGTQNFWTGMHVNTQFSMPAGGQVLNPSGVLKPMQFEFSGDDDVWIYVDGILIGDAGGIHNRTEVDINFQTGIVSISGQPNKYLDDLFRVGLRDQSKTEAEIEEYITQNFDGHTFKAGTYHTFDFFYLERGGGESNLYIHYNLVSTADFTAHKAYYGEDETDILKRDQFQFELIGLDGKYRSVKNNETGNYELVQEDTTSDAIMPHASGSGEGTVASPHYEDNVSTTLSNGGTVNSQVYITGVTEDGNINFGSASISEIDMNEADQGNPPVYKYIIREIVPDDAVNQDGITWASATDAQKAAGGFVKDQVTYDGTVYYMTGRVTSWTETDASGQEVVRHGISKTYYTDDTYTTVRDDVDFASFENRFTPDYGSVEFTKVDGAGDPLEGAEFTLYKDEGCTIPATDLDTEGNPVWTATSDSNGKVSFENVRVGTYYMKETTAPQGYKLSDTVYKVIIIDSKDKSSVSTIIRNGDETETVIKKIFNTRISTEGLEVDKIWKGGEPSSDTTIIYKLYQTSARTRTGNYTVDVSGLGYGKPDWSNGRFFTNDELTGTKTAIKKGSVIEIVITTTSDQGGTREIWSFDTLNETTQISSNQTILSDILTSSVDGNVRQRTIRIQVTDESTNTICLYGQLESCYDGNGGKPTISSSIISEPSSSEEGETKLVGTVILGKNTVSSDIESEFQNLDPAIVVTTGTNDWTSVIKNLPENTSEGDWNITYAYYVEEVETSVPSGFEFDFISPAAAVPGETITIVNKTETPESINVVIKKTDNAENSTNYLDGAVFKLMYRSDSSGTYTNVSNESVTELNSDSQFTVPTAGITLTGLVDGQYQLQEISPPSGYVITNSTPVTFTISGGAITSTEGTITGVRYTAASGTSDAEFIIPNEPGAALPNTGGPGTRLFTILGSILTLGAVVLLWRRRRLI